MADSVEKPKQTAPELRPWGGCFWFPQETLILCVVSLLDVAMTLRLLTRDDIQFIESNPFAGYFLDHWGIAGMAYFKVAMTCLACVISQIVSWRDPVLSRQLLSIATVIVAGVVIYSVWLHFNHREVVHVLEVHFREISRETRCLPVASMETSRFLGTNGITHLTANYI